MPHKYYLNIVAIFAIALGCLLVAQNATAQTDQGGTLFFEGIQDVPVMPGLVEMEEYTLVFDKPEGRIVEILARIEGGQSDSAVRKFYAHSLPQLGWEMISADHYVRGQEHLSLDIEKESDDSFLRLSVEPHVP